MLETNPYGEKRNRGEGFGQWGGEVQERHVAGWGQVQRGWYLSKSEESEGGSHVDGWGENGQPVQGPWGAATQVYSCNNRKASVPGTESAKERVEGEASVATLVSITQNQEILPKVQICSFSLRKLEALTALSIYSHVGLARTDTGRPPEMGLHCPASHRPRLIHFSYSYTLWAPAAVETTVPGGSRWQHQGAQIRHRSLSPPLPSLPLFPSALTLCLFLCKLNKDFFWIRLWKGSPYRYREMIIPNSANEALSLERINGLYGVCACAWGKGLQGSKEIFFLFHSDLSPVLAAGLQGDFIYFFATSELIHKTPNCVVITPPHMHSDGYCHKTKIKQKTRK